MFSFFLLSCWHLFLALPLLYLCPLIVITACKEARIGEINKLSLRKKSNNPECSWGRFRQEFGNQREREGYKYFWDLRSSVMEERILGLSANLSGNVMTLWWQQDQKEAAGVMDCFPLSAVSAADCLARGRDERSAKQSHGGSMPSTTAVTPGLFLLILS